MKTLKGVSHPSLAVLCSDMRKEDMLVRVDLVNAQRGQPPTKRIKQIYVQLQTRLRRICQDNEAGIRDMEETLAGIGYNIRWNAPIHGVEN